MSRVRLLQEENKRLRQVLIREQSVLTQARAGVEDLQTICQAAMGHLDLLTNAADEEELEARLYDARIFLNGPAP